MVFEEDCLELFGTKNLYEIFNLSQENGQNIKQSEIKKAYYKCSLKYHPDRAELANKDLATKKFQYLSKAYSVLSDKDRRAVYDDTGIVDDETIDEDKDWYAYWRLLFKKITTKDIVEFEKKYKHSDDERQDLKTAYVKFKGNMNKVMEEIMCATNDDEERFAKILKEMIETEQVPDFTAFSKEPVKKKLARKRKADKEAKEAVVELEKLTGRKELDSGSLEKLITQRNADRGKRMNSLLDELAAKYASVPKRTRAKR